MTYTHNYWDNPSRTLGDIIKTDVQLSWLNVLFRRKSTNNDCTPASEEEDMKRTRGYILYLLGSSLFSNTSGDKVSLEYLPFLENLYQTTQYSWDSASLIFLYIGLCKCVGPYRKCITGCILFLQVHVFI